MANNKAVYTFKIDYEVEKSGLRSLESVKKVLEDIANKSTFGQKMDTKKISEVSAMAKTLLDTMTKIESQNMGKLNLGDFNAELKKAGLSLETVGKSLSSYGETGQRAFNRLTTELATVERKSYKVSKLLDKGYETMMKTARWSASSSFINSVSGGFQRAVGYVKDLDESLTNIRIVTNMSANDIERFADSANKAAKSVGTSTLDYTDAALIYFQQGKNEEESNKLANITTKAANVSQSTAEEMSSYLTAVWNGYKINSDHAEVAVDKLAAVAAATGADLAELSIGMSRVASAANVMGVDMDQLNAMISTIVTVTKEAPETVGTTLKTVFSRMESLVSGAKDEDGIGLGRVSQDLSEMGVRILDEQGKLRNLGMVIEEVGNKWGKYTKEQQVALVQSMAGTRQYNRLLTVFDNWDMYKTAKKTSEEGLGTLQEQQDIYYKSVEGFSEKTRAEFEALFTDIIDPDFLKFLTVAIEGVSQTIRGLIQGIGGLVPTIGLMSGALMRAFSGKLSRSINDQIGNIKSLRANMKEVENIKEALGQIDLSTYGLDLSKLEKYIEQVQKYWKIMDDGERQQARAHINDGIAMARSLQDQELKLEKLKEQRRIMFDLLKDEYGTDKIPLHSVKQEDMNALFSYDAFNAPQNFVEDMNKGRNIEDALVVYDKIINKKGLIEKITEKTNIEQEQAEKISYQKTLEQVNIEKEIAQIRNNSSTTIEEIEERIKKLTMESMAIGRDSSKQKKGLDEIKDAEQLAKITADTSNKLDEIRKKKADLQQLISGQDGKSSALDTAQLELYAKEAERIKAQAKEAKKSLDPVKDFEQIASIDSLAVEKLSELKRKRDELTNKKLVPLGEEDLKTVALLETRIANLGKEIEEIGKQSIARAELKKDLEKASVKINDMSLVKESVEKVPTGKEVGQTHDEKIANITKSLSNAQVLVEVLDKAGVSSRDLKKKIREVQIELNKKPEVGVFNDSYLDYMSGSAEGFKDMLTPVINSEHEFIIAGEKMRQEFLKLGTSQDVAKTDLISYSKEQEKLSGIVKEFLNGNGVMPKNKISEFLLKLEDESLKAKRNIESLTETIEKVRAANVYEIHGAMDEMNTKVDESSTKAAEIGAKLAKNIDEGFNKNVNLEGISTIQQKLDTLGNGLMIGSSLSGFAQNIRDIGASMGDAEGKSESMVQALTAIGGQTGSLAMSFSMLSGSIKEAGGAMKFFQSSNGIVLAISVALQLAIGAFQMFTAAEAEAEEKQKEILSNWENAVKELKSLNDELKTTNDKIDELNRKDNLSVVEQAELDKLKATNAELERKIFLQKKVEEADKNKVVDSMEEKFEDTYGNAIKEKKDYLQMSERTAANPGSLAEDEFLNVVDQVVRYAKSDDIEEAIKGYILKRDLLAKNFVFSNKEYEKEFVSAMEEVDGPATATISKKILDLQKEQEKIREIYKDAKLSRDSGTLSSTQSKTIKEYEKVEDQIRKMMTLIGQGKEYAAFKLQEIWADPKLKSSIAEFQKAVNAGTLTPESAVKMKDFNEIIKQTGLSVPDLVEHLKSLAVEDKGFDMSKIETFAQLLDSVGSKAKLAGTAMKEMNKNHFVTNDTVAKLLQKFPDLEKHLTKVKKGYALSRDAVASMRTETMKSYKLDIVNALKAAGYVVTAEEMKRGSYKGTLAIAKASLKEKIKLTDIEIKDQQRASQASANKLYADIQKSQVSLSLATGLPSLLNLGKPATAAKSPATATAEKELAKLKAQLKAINASQKEVQNAEDIWKDAFNSGKKVGDSSSKAKKSKFSNAIDWAANSVANLTANLEKLKLVLSRIAEGGSKKSVLTSLLGNEANLQSNYYKVAESQAKAYAKYLKKISGGGGKYKALIESDHTFKQEDFAGKSGGSAEKKYKAIVKAQNAYKTLQETLKNADAISDTMTDLAKQLAGADWDIATYNVGKLNTAIETLKARLSAAGDVKSINTISDSIEGQTKKVLTTQKNALIQNQKDLKASWNSIKGFVNKKDDPSNGINETGKTSKGNKFTSAQLAAVKKYNAYLAETAENANLVKKAELDVAEALGEAVKARLSAIQSYYNNHIGLLKNAYERINDYQSLIEAKGLNMTKTLYQAQETSIKNQIKQQDNLTTQMKNSLEKSLKDGKIKKFSSAWFEMNQMIEDSVSASVALNLSLVNIGNSISQLNVEAFKRISTELKKTSDEASFIQGFITDQDKVTSTGGLTNVGKTSVGLSAVKYGIFDELAANAKAGMIASQKAMDGAVVGSDIWIRAKKNLEDYTAEYYENANAARESKQAIVDIVKEGLQKQIDSVKELNDAKKDLLDTEKEEQDYQDSLNEKTKKNTELQKQIKMLENDKSAEGQKRLRELKAQLVDAKKDLANTKKDYAIKMKKESLDADTKSVTETIQEQMKQTEALFNGAITTINDKSTGISNAIISFATSLGITLDSALTKIIKTPTIASADTTGTGQTTGTGTNTVVKTVTGVDNKLQDKVDNQAADAAAKAAKDLADKKAADAAAKAAKDLADKKKVINGILGKSAYGNVMGNKGESSLNDYLASLGYGQMSYAQMIALAKVLGIKNADTVAKVKTEPISKSIATELSKYVDETGLRKGLLASSYNAWKYQQKGGGLAPIGRILNIDSINSEEAARKDLNSSSSKMKAGLKKYGFLDKFGFKTGGVATGLHEILNATGDEGFAAISRGETTLTQDFTNLMPLSVELMKLLADNNINKTLKNISEISTPKFGNAQATNTSIEVTLDGPLIQVETLNEDMLNKIKNDKQIQKAVQDVTIGQMTKGAYNAGTRW